MKFDWDNLNDTTGNTYHLLSQHPEMRSTRFVEEVFLTPSGDEDFYESPRGRTTFLVVEKTYRRKLYRLVFRTNQTTVRIQTAMRITKRRS